MRTHFSEFYRPTEAEFDDLWKRCLFAFDANVLLNLYFYSRPTARTYTTVLRLLKDRLWLPYQAGLEYQRNRAGVISKVAKGYTEANKAVEALRAVVRSKTQPPFLDDDLSDKLESALVEVSEHIGEALDASKVSINKDDIRDELDEIFAGRVGAKLEDARLNAIYAEGKGRYRDRVPPGYKDEKEKPGNDMFGDLVIWKELIEKARSEGRPMIFVTDDAKEDWWNIHDDRTHGPRPELLREFAVETGERCYLYNSESFLRFADRHLTAHVDDAAFDELTEAQERDRHLTFEMGYEHLNLPADAALDALGNKIDDLDPDSPEYSEACEIYDRLLSARRSEAFVTGIDRLLSPAAKARRAELVGAIRSLLADCRIAPSWDGRSEYKLNQWLEHVPEDMIPYTSLPKLTTIRNNLEEYLRRHREPPAGQEPSE